MATIFFHEKAHAFRWNLEFLYLIYLPLQYKYLNKFKKSRNKICQTVISAENKHFFVFFLETDHHSAHAEPFALRNRSCCPLKGKTSMLELMVDVWQLMKC